MAKAKNKVAKLSAAERAAADAAAVGRSSAIQDTLQGYGDGTVGLGDVLSTAQSAHGEFDREAGRREIRRLKAQADKLAKLASGGPSGVMKYGTKANKAQKAYQAALGAERKAVAAHGRQGEQLQSELYKQLAVDPRTGSKYALEQVMGSNPLTQQIFGEGGLASRLVEEEKGLTSQGFKLTDEDRTAYGQAAGDIARQFGQQESNLASALAARGLSNSGAAAAGFSGLQGNKFEQLAKQQMDIAQRRYQDNVARVNATRQQIANSQAQQAGLVQDQYNRNTGGVQMSNANAQQAVDNAFRQKMANQQQVNTQFDQEQATAGPGLGDILGGVGTTVLGAASGGVGTALGAGAGKALSKKLF